MSPSGAGADGSTRASATGVRRLGVVVQRQEQTLGTLDDCLVSIGSSDGKSAVDGVEGRLVLAEIPEGRAATQ